MAWPSTVTQNLCGSALRRPRHAPPGGSLEPSESLTQTRGADLEDDRLWCRSWGSTQAVVTFAPYSPNSQAFQNKTYQGNYFIYSTSVNLDCHRPPSKVTNRDLAQLSRQPPPCPVTCPRPVSTSRRRNLFKGINNIILNHHNPLFYSPNK